jgi:hypothetical protein
MKSHMRKHRNTGGVNEAEKDLHDHPEARTNAREIDREAEERKHGGRTKRKAGGECHEGFGPEHETTMRAKRKRGGLVGKKHVEMHGEKAEHHMGRKPRKSGGKATSDMNPFTSARHGEAPKGRKLDMEMDGL